MQFLGFWWPASVRRSNNSATLSGVGSYGIYWSASPHPSYPYDAYDLAFYSGNVSPANVSSRSYGFSVRCVQE